MNKKSLFMDHALIQVVAGTGGNGASHFRREKYVPLGGPDGGDGGRGGDVILKAEPGLKTLVDFSYRRKYAAKNGNPGEGTKKNGKQAENVLIRVPLGTVVLGKDGELLADLSDPGQEWIAAKGGRGGRGNVHFATALRQAPVLAEKGEPGEERELRLELKLLADVGLVGLPNAGKSSILAALSAARPKIADYPFTTLTPNLGIVRIDEGASFALVDIPGLIEGASRGAGLGHEFLRHIERTRLLIHVVDVGFPGVEPLAAYRAINRELELYNPGLAKRPQIIALNKADLVPDPAAIGEWIRMFRKEQAEVFVVSAATRQGLPELAQKANDLLAGLPASPGLTPLRRRALPKLAPRFVLEKEEEGLWRVRGKEPEKWVAMTDFDNPEALAKLKNIFDRIGLSEEFSRLGVREGDTVVVGKEEFFYKKDEEEK